MKINIWIKLVALLTALTATIVAIFWLKQDHMSSFWTSLGVHSQSRINWCEERVESLFFYDSQIKIHEKKGQWLLKAQTESSLDYMRVEKWFAQYCQVAVEKNENHPHQEPKPYFEVQFINGARMTLYQFSDQSFRIKDLDFKSETLRQALKELLAFTTKIE